MKNALRWSLALMLSGTGLWFALRGADLGAVASAVSGLQSPGWLLLFPAAAFVEFFFRSWRWMMLLSPLTNARARAMFPIVSAAFFLNSVLPFRAGEFARVYWTAQKTGLPWTSCLSALVVDRVFDLMSLLFFVAIVLVRSSRLFPSPGPVIAFVGGTLGLLLALLLLARFPAFFGRLAGRRWMPERLRRWILGFIEGSVALRRPVTFLAALGVSLMFWTMNLGLLMMVARLFGLPLGWTDSAWVEIGICAGVLLPAAPGYVGTLEAAGVAALGILGYGRHEALPVILVLHALYIFNTVLYGVPSLWLAGLRAPKKNLAPCRPGDFGSDQDARSEHTLAM